MNFVSEFHSTNYGYTGRVDNNKGPLDLWGEYDQVRPPLPFPAPRNNLDQVMIVKNLDFKILQEISQGWHKEPNPVVLGLTIKKKKYQYLNKTQNPFCLVG